MGCFRLLIRSNRSKIGAKCVKIIFKHDYVNKNAKQSGGGAKKEDLAYNTTLSPLVTDWNTQEA